MKKRILTFFTASILFVSSIAPLTVNADSYENLALQKKAYCSSIEGNDFKANKAFDGDDSTRWASREYNNKEWIYLDLGSKINISKVILKWEAAYAKSYQIQLSDNGKTWRNVYETYSGGNGNIDEINFPQTSARFVKMYAFERGTEYGYSLYEFEVYNGNKKVSPVSENAQNTIYKLTSVFENSTPDLQYSYCEDIDDGRGLTFGFAGFCSGTFDGTMFLKVYQSLNPNNLLVKYIPTFERIDSENTEGMNPDTSGLEDFAEDFASCIGDPAFIQAQHQLVDKLYWNPSQAAAGEIGARLNITRGELYDAFINHGEDGAREIIDIANQNAGGTPMSGIDEETWLNEFLAARLDVLESDPTWRESVDRVHAYQNLLDEGNVDLQTPMTINCYGDTFKIE